jgi:hypothetical protein
MVGNGVGTVTAWNTNGTILGGYKTDTSDWINFFNSTTNSAFKVSSTGIVTTTNFANFGGDVNSTSTAGFGFGSRSYITSPADGKVLFRNNAQTGFTIIQFGGTTSSFPGIQTNGANLQAELADGSAQTGWSAASLTTATVVVGSLPSASTNTGKMIVVSDSTTIVTEGQTCVGSSSGTALAFSNGTVWKCF